MANRKMVSGDIVRLGMEMFWPITALDWDSSAYPQRSGYWATSDIYLYPLGMHKPSGDYLVKLTDGDGDAKSRKTVPSRYWKCRHYPSAIDNHYSGEKCEHGCHEVDPRWHDHGFSVKQTSREVVDGLMDICRQEFPLATEFEIELLILQALCGFPWGRQERRSNDNGCKTPTKY
jgi:hypothetical protein